MSPGSQARRCRCLDRRAQCPGQCALLKHCVAGSLASLTEMLTGEGEMRTALFDDAENHCVVDEIRRGVDPGPPANVELGLPKRRRTFVLHDLHPRSRADRLVADLQRTDAPNV